MSAAASIAARVAGAVLALGFLLSVVDGPIVGAVGGVAVSTFGRGLAGRRGWETLPAASLAVLAGSSGVVALRWGTLELAELRGIHAVLGPTPALEPVPAAVATALAVVAATVAAAVWLSDPPAAPPLAWWWWVEAATVTLLVVALFLGPQPAGVREVLAWIGSAAVLGALAVAGAVLLRDRGMRASALAIAAAGAVTAAAAAVVGSGL